MNTKQAAGKRLNMTERAQQQLDLHFPAVAPHLLWIRKKNHGFSTVPRTMPIAMQVIDEDSTKGNPAGHTLFCLWARSPDNPLVIIDNPLTFAAEAGFKGQRALDTWRRRMKELKKLGFIETASGPSGDFHYVLLLNPNVVVQKLWEAGRVQRDLYARFIDRITEIGGQNDLELYNAAKTTALSSPPPAAPPLPNIAPPLPSSP